MEFSEEHGRLIAVKSSGVDPVSEVYGCLGKKIDTDAVMAQLRGHSVTRKRAAEGPVYARPVDRRSGSDTPGHVSDSFQSISPIRRTPKPCSMN
jgi:hypothetical protein